MYEGSGGDAETSAADQTQKVHPFNRSFSSKHQDARTIIPPPASPHSSVGLQSYKLNSPHQAPSAASPHSSVGLHSFKLNSPHQAPSAASPHSSVGLQSFKLNSPHQASPHQASPSPRSSDLWQSYKLESPGARTSPARENRMDQEDISSRDEPDQIRMDHDATTESHNSFESHGKESSTKVWNEIDSMGDPDWPPQEPALVAAPAATNKASASLENENEEPPAEPSLSSSRLSRLQTMRSRTPVLPTGAENAELKRNLDAASVVLEEEKVSR
jgi:hypothetical protein